MNTLELDIIFFILDWLAIQKSKYFFPMTIKQEILSVLQKTKIYEELWKLSLLECQKKVDEEILECVYEMYSKVGID